MVVQYEHTEYCQAVCCQMKKDAQLEGMVMGPLCLRIHCLSCLCGQKGPFRESR